MDNNIVNISPDNKVTEVKTEEKIGHVLSILCIDMNIIMYNAIKLYFKDINPEENDTIQWNMLNSMKDIDQFLSFDLGAYNNIIKLIKRFNVNQSITEEKLNSDGEKEFSTTVHETQLVFVDSQKQIIDHLELDDLGIMYKIDNLDFYPDLFVDYKKDKQLLKHFNKYNDLNWVGYIDAKKKLFEYNWISAPNSPLLDPGLKFNCKNINHIGYYNIDKVLENTRIAYSHIFISKSSSYVPYKYKHLYDILKLIYSDDNDNKE